jgi:hypothetical protein
VPVPSPTETPVPGDLNGDGGVDILDLQLCVNVVLGTETTPAIVAASDLNGDSIADILDVQLLVNIILGSG